MYFLKNLFCSFFLMTGIFFSVAPTAQAALWYENRSLNSNLGSNSPWRLLPIANTNSISEIGPIYPHYLLYINGNSALEAVRFGWWFLKPEYILNVYGFFYSVDGKLLNRTGHF